MNHKKENKQINHETLFTSPAVYAEYQQLKKFVDQEGNQKLCEIIRNVEDALRNAANESDTNTQKFVDELLQQLRSKIKRGEFDEWSRINSI